MIIDVHMHAFPHQGTAAGYPDVKTHLMIQQNKIERFFGRMVTSTLDPKFKPAQNEDVNFRIGQYGRWLWTKHGVECWLQRYSPFLVEMEWKPEQLIAFMDSIGVHKGVLQSGYMDNDFCRSYYADCVRRWPDRFIGTVTIDYDITKDERYRRNELEKLKEAVLQWGCAGVFQGFPKGQPIDDPAFDPLWSEMSRLGIPHFFFIGFEPKKPFLETLARLERMLRKFDGLTAIAGHLGGNVRHPSDPNFTDTPNELMSLLRLPNFHFEVGYIMAYENWDVWHADYEYPYPLHKQLIKRIYDEVGASRLLWGSDMPHNFRCCTYQQCLDLVRLHCEFMSEEERNGVLGGNAARIFRV